MSVLSKEGLTKEAKLKTREVPLESGAVVLVSEIPQTEYEAVYKAEKNKKLNEAGESILDSEGEPERDYHKITTDMIIASVVNEDGSKMFDESDFDLVAGYSRDVRDKIFSGFLKVNGVDVESKKSEEPIKNGSDNSESQLVLDIGTPTN